MTTNWSATIDKDGRTKNKVIEAATKEEAIRKIREEEGGSYSPVGIKRINRL